MGVTDRIFEQMQKMIVLGEKFEQLDGRVQSLALRLEKLDERITDVDRRLLRFETKAEIFERLSLPKGG